jgi:hypothetical protein
MLENIKEKIGSICDSLFGDSISYKTVAIVAILIGAVVALVYFKYYTPSSKGSPSELETKGQAQVLNQSPIQQEASKAKADEINTIREKLKELNLILFVSEKSDVSKKQVELLSEYSDILRIEDIDSDNANLLIKNTGLDRNLLVDKVLFISGAGYTFIGSNKTAEEIITIVETGLAKKQGPSLEELGVVMLAQDGCGACNKAKHYIKENNSPIKIINSNSQEGVEMGRNLKVTALSILPRQEKFTEDMLTR